MSSGSDTGAAGAIGSASRAALTAGSSGSRLGSLPINCLNAPESIPRETSAVMLAAVHRHALGQACSWLGVALGFGFGFGLGLGLGLGIGLG
eukprot:scaffold28188_cov66-Phaeocystis_antarctica.AAC.2